MQLNVTYEEAESRWFNHLNAMRSEKRMAQSFTV